MPHEIRMPQLGMAQESGIIVSWLKAQGDPVSAGEALFEVETDKATMEVEAPVDGFLAGLRAGEGDDVPVGEVIAMIVESATEADADKGAPRPAVAAPTAPAPEPAPQPAPEPALAAASPAGTGRVLASPRARRLALDRGIDLTELRAQGVAEPIHAADVTAARGGGHSALTARVAAAALDALVETSGDPGARTSLLAAFAAGAWRARFDVADVTVMIRDPGGASAPVVNPDRGGAGTAGAATMSLVDLCDTGLSGYFPAAGGATLSAARSGASIVLTLSFGEAALPLPHAVALLDDIAGRIQNPIRQLL